MTHYRKALIHRAMTAALSTRAELGHSLDDAVCVFDIAKTLGLNVRFDHMETKNFEGLYNPSIQQIILESHRPSLRQRFTCAHEVGHHILKHGEVPNCVGPDGALTHTNTPQEELLANVFASFLLMPKAAVLTAFRKQGVKPADATPKDFYLIASWLGVGFSTFIRHCATYFPTHLSSSHAGHCLKFGRSLSKIRYDILDGLIPREHLKRLTVYQVTEEWKRPLDLVAGNDSASSDGDIARFEFDVSNPPSALLPVGPRCFRAVKEGTFTLHGPRWVGTLRCYTPTKGGKWKVRIFGDSND